MSLSTEATSAIVERWEKLGFTMDMSLCEEECSRCQNGVKALNPIVWEPTLPHPELLTKPVCVPCARSLVTKGIL